MIKEKFEEHVAITGIGMSEVGRRLLRDPLELSIDACLAAIEDAGLRKGDIDGLSTYPGAPSHALHGASGGNVEEVEEILQIQPRWFSSGMELAGQTGSVVNAMLAVAGGLATHVLCWRSLWEGSAAYWQRNGTLPTEGARPAGAMQWRVPYGAMSPANWIAMMANRHFHEFGTTREQLAQIALNARKNAALNPKAIYRDPLTMDDYLNARMITTPFGLYDCDVPCDCAVAVIVSAIDTAKDLRQRPVLVEAVGTQITERPSWDQGSLIHEPMVEGPAKSLWERTTMRPADVDVAEIYDGFSFNCLSWIEALGFCGVGEGGPFIEGGQRIALDGELPLNTAGGQLSAGRLHGYGFLYEAVVQLRGDGGARQVNGAEVAILATGGGAPGGAMLLTRG
jgi:acetyl-CoA acetyltransferase